MVKMSMVMTPISQVAIPARGKTSFNPNGMHIMLYGLKSRPVPGDTLNVTLKLDDGTTVPVEATVRK
jgi:copper(I)-binding protein